MDILDIFDLIYSIKNKISDNEYLLLNDKIKRMFDIINELDPNILNNQNDSQNDNHIVPSNNISLIHSENHNNETHNNETHNNETHNNETHNNETHDFAPCGCYKLDLDNFNESKLVNDLYFCSNPFACCNIEYMCEKVPLLNNIYSNIKNNDFVNDICDEDNKQLNNIILILIYWRNNNMGKFNDLILLIIIDCAFRYYGTLRESSQSNIRFKKALYGIFYEYLEERRSFRQSFIHYDIDFNKWVELIDKMGSGEL